MYVVISAGSHRKDDDYLLLSSVMTDRHDRRQLNIYY